MFFVALARIIKFGFQSFWRNIWLSLVTIVILVLTLFLISLTIFLNIVADSTIESVKERIDVALYFDTVVKEKQVLDVREYLISLDEVKEVTYISKEQALQTFKEEHRDDPAIQETIEALEENPLPSSLVIKAKTLDDYPAILSAIDSSQYSSLIEDQDKDFEDNQLVISRLSQIANRLQQGGYVISGIFISVALLVVYNTIRIMIYTHREEIGIMRLVGATNWFIRGPFVFESIFYALLASAITIAIIYPLFIAIAPYISNFFEGYNINIIDSLRQNFLMLFGIQTLVALFLSMVSSLTAMGRYLRV